jgi:hypothetical protein
MSILYFDVETTSTGRDGAPVDVVLAVTRVDGIDTVWRGTPFAAFSPETAVRLAIALTDHDGHVCTFNGAGFDFKVIAALLPADAGALRSKLVRVCFHAHVDIFFDYFTSVGYYASLESFCVGSNLAGKTWSGAESAAAVIAVLAETDNNLEREAVATRLAAYCAEDVACLERLSDHVAKHSCLYRRAKSGRVSAWVPWLLTRFRTVAACLTEWQAHPVVATWLSDPPPPPTTTVAWVVP